MDARVVPGRKGVTITLHLDRQDLAIVGRTMRALASLVMQFEAEHGSGGQDTLTTPATTAKTPPVIPFPNSITTFPDAFRLVLGRHGYNATSFCRIASLSRATISRFIKTSHSSPRSKANLRAGLETIGATQDEIDKVLEFLS